MADPVITAADGPAIARILAAHRRRPVPPPDRAPAAARAFSRALRHAATPFPGLGLSITKADFAADLDLLQVIEAQPDHGLVAVCEDDAGRRGLLALSHGCVDALIEVQTTGRVEAQSLPPRPVTQIDEALNRDYLDLFLAAFTREMTQVEGRDWPLRMQFGSLVKDRGQLNLLLPEAHYAIFSADLGFDGTERKARAVFALPSDPALADPTVAEDSSPSAADPAWNAALHAILRDLCVPLDAILLRHVMPLGQVQSLAVGDVIPFAAQDLQAVALEDAQGRVMMRGQLGQLGGKRAIRPAVGAGRHPAPPVPPLPEPPADPRPRADAAPLSLDRTPDPLPAPSAPATQ